jgi:23S rRNA-/tRNA-specific pseudouridylate synthase
MRVFYKDSNSTGTTVTLEVEGGDTIRKVKAKIVQAEAQTRTLCTCRLRLQYGQHTDLADERTLVDYSIPEWSTLDLCVRAGRLPRCGPTCTAVAAAGRAGTGVAAAAAAALPILFQDEHFVAVSKPAGLLVHPTPEARGVTDTVLVRLAKLHRR